MLRLIVAALFAVLATAATDQPRQGVPVISTVDPDSGKPGDLVTVSGEYLDQSRVLEVYLTTAKADVKAKIVEQSEKSLKLRIPEEAAPGRYRLTVLMAGTEPKLLEQPVSLVVK